MSEVETQLRREVLEYEEIIAGNLVDLEKSYMALDELLNQYQWDYVPSARKALEYAMTVHLDEHCDNEAKLSWQYITDYKKIMWLISVARDYCYSALESCNKVYLERGANNGSSKES